MRFDQAGIALAIRSGRPGAGRSLLVAASGLAVLLAAGCGSHSGPGGPVSGTVTIAAVPGVDDAPIYLAKKDGLFAAEGLSNVTIKTYSNAAAELSALQSGHADIAASDYGSIFYTQANGPHDLRLLANGYDATQGVVEILTLAGSSIRQPGDLTKAGVEVGLPNDDTLSNLVGSGQPPSLEAAAATQVLNSYVGNAALNVDWQPMSQSQEISELRNHQLQAILVTEPYIYQAESQFGATELLDACSGYTANLPLSGYVATDAWVRHNSAAVADFQEALAKAQSDASMTGAVQKLLPASTGLTAQDADLITIGSYPTSTTSAGLQTVLALMTANKFWKPTQEPSLGQMLVKNGS